MSSKTWLMPEWMKLPICALGMALILTMPTILVHYALLSAPYRIALPWRIYLVAAFFLLVLMILMRPNEFSYWLAKREMYRLALLVNRFSYFTSTYIASVRGWILLEAGMFEEARTYTKRFAFDEKGQPLVGTWELYAYVQSLVIAREFEAADKLCESTARGDEPAEWLGIPWTNSLLKQKKNVERAREIIEKMLDEEERSPTRSTNRLITGIAVHAWALAECGRADQAKARLEEVLTALPHFKRRDRAALGLTIAATWCALGDTPNAHLSLLEAARLHPSGYIGFAARRQLEEIGGVA